MEDGKQREDGVGEENWGGEGTARWQLLQPSTPQPHRSPPRPRPLPQTLPRPLPKTLPRPLPQTQTLAPQSQRGAARRRPKKRPSGACAAQLLCQPPPPSGQLIGHATSRRQQQSCCARRPPRSAHAHSGRRTRSRRICRPKRRGSQPPLRRIRPLPTPLRRGRHPLRRASALEACPRCLPARRPRASRGAYRRVGRRIGRPAHRLSVRGRRSSERGLLLMSTTAPRPREKTSACGWRSSSSRRR